MGKEDYHMDVALAKEACPLCGKAEDGPILIGKRLVKEKGKVERELHGKVIGYMDKPCTECQELMSKGFLLIGVVEAKTDDKNNPYRSGNQWVVTHDYAKRLFKSDTSKGVAFIDVQAAEMIGLPDVKLDA